jgi:AcrR family transcriptional regulator
VALDPDSATRPKRPHLTSRPRVVEQAVALLDEEGAEGLSMRKLASALHVSLPTVYAAVESRNQLVQEVLRVGLGRELSAADDRNGVDAVEPARVLSRLVESTSRHPWLHDLAQELDTSSLLGVTGAVAADCRPSVMDRLVEHFEKSERNADTRMDAAQMLFLVVLLLDDVARLVAAGRCSAERKGQLGQALLRTMLEPQQDWSEPLIVA